MSDEDEAPPQSAEEPISGEVDLTEADYVEAHTSYARKKGLLKSSLVLQGGILALTSLAVALFWPLSPGVWTLLLPAVLLSIVLTTRQWSWLGRRRFAGAPPARRRFRVEMSQEGLLAVGAKSEIFYRWTLMTGWVESEHLFVFLGSTGVADLFPKRAFASADLPALRELFDEHIHAPAPPVAPAAERGPLKSGDPLPKILIFVGLIFLVVLIAQLVKT